MQRQEIFHGPSSSASPPAHPRCLPWMPTPPGSGHPATLPYYRIADVVSTWTILSSFLMNLASLERITHHLGSM
jgi:hypothetical protein